MSQECPETPKSEEPIEQINDLITPAPSSPTSRLHPSQKQRNPGKGVSPKACQPLTWILPAPGFGTTSRGVERYTTGGGNSGPFATQMLSHSMTSK